MSERYRIKNCPAYIHRPLNNHDRVCLLGDKVKPNHKELYVYCQDCTDCVLKQIVELCKDYYKNCEIEGNCIDDRTCTSCFFGGGNELAQDILSNLDIEECE